MAVFAYTAKTVDGKKVESVIRASDKGAAQAELKKKNLTVSTLVEQKGGKKTSLFGPPRPHVGTKDIAVMTRQLSTMISAGIPLLESLEILHEQASDPGFKSSLDKIIERVRAGSDFSTALSEHPKLFTKIYVNMIKAGEASGQLDVILQRLADYMESVEELKREIRAAMTYPVISLVLILTITVGLIVGIVPKFQTIFEQMEMKELPLPTEILLKISDMLREQYLVVIGVAFVVIVAFLMYIKTKPGMRQWHWVLLHAPVFGPL